jgi:hypothetical protein
MERNSVNIETYMRTVIGNLHNKKLLAELKYSESDKDCGYISGLRYLKLQQTSETDDIANSVIYRTPLKKITVPRILQLELF